MGGSRSGGTRLDGRAVDLVDDVADHLMRTGLVDLSLRSMADALGVSHRMLLYYFDNRNDLMAPVLERIASRMRAEGFGAVETAEPGCCTTATVDFLFGDRGSHLMGLQLDAWTSAARGGEPYRSFVSGEQSWLPVFERALLRDGVELARVDRMATQMLAAVVGVRLGSATGAADVPGRAAVHDLLHRLRATA